MTSKKYKFLLSAFMFLAVGAFAQVGGSGSVYDSSVIPAKRMPQQNEFWNKSYNFPAKPRNQWEVGVSTGLFTVSGDVAAKAFTAPNFGVHVRKAFGYIFSLRLQYINTVGKGQNWLASSNFGKNEAWNLNLPAGKRYFSPERSNTGAVTYTDRAGNASATADQVYYNYKTKVQDLGLQGIVTLNNIRFHKQKTGIVLYGGGGIGATLYNTMVNSLDANGNPYRALFNGLASGTYSNRKDVLKALKNGMDKTYETPAENQGSRRPKIGKNTLKPSGTVLAGVAFKLGKRVNLAIEDRWTFTKDDLLDGQQWQEQAWGDASLTGDFDSYNYASIGLNFNLGAKSVEPLWWQNPLDYAYDELMNHRNVKIPKMECPDTDGDGVCDHLDREPNTPAGCPVNTHGVTADTDGDGVPDCKDKELITPTSCQPVDADGVGKCPDPECCKNPKVVVPPCPTDYPSLSFKGNSPALTADAKSMLATCAAKLKGSPTCTITVTGYPEASKASQANCNKRLEAIKNYLVEKEGISADRITTNCEVGGGDKNTVDIKSN
ncbi:OmpA family protein [Ferruginibacter sp. SUN106]|uniref:OmpA family protein n=1 Tax=Ferruginibacter sp. SUN106 TaxID=2978348 RepID=UPI003D363D78